VPLFAFLCVELLPLSHSFSTPPSAFGVRISVHKPSLRPSTSVFARRSLQTSHTGTLPLHQSQPDQGESDQTVSNTDAFPPPWLIPFLVPALGGALFGFDIGSSSSVVRILGEKVTDLGEFGHGAEPVSGTRLSCSLSVEEQADVKLSRIRAARPF